MITTTGTDTTSTKYIHWDMRPELAHQYCQEMLKNNPDGMVPIQSVYEYLLRIIGRDDIINAIKEDQK